MSCFSSANYNKNIRIKRTDIFIVALLKNIIDIKLLFQEMQLKIELGFINAISCLFEEEEILDENTPEKLEKDLELARKPLQV